MYNRVILVFFIDNFIIVYVFENKLIIEINHYFRHFQKNLVFNKLRMLDIFIRENIYYNIYKKSKTILINFKRMKN